VRFVWEAESFWCAEFCFASTPSIVQVVLSTAHPAKFSEAVTKALSASQGFDFERNLFPQEFRGLLEKERRVIDIDEPSEELVKKVIESKVASASTGVRSV
jgi:threonine synthase